MKCEINKYRQWMGHKGPVYTLSAIDDMHFISAGSDGMIIQWNLDGEQHGEAIAKVSAQVFCSHYLPDTHQLLLGAMDGHLYVIDFNLKQCIRNIDLQNGSVFCILSNDGYIYAGTQNGKLYLFNRSFDLVNILDVCDKSLRDLEMHTYIDEIYVASSDKNIYIIDTESHSIKSHVQSAQHSVFSLAYSSKHKKLFSGSRDARLYEHYVNADTIQSNEIAAHLFTINDLLIDAAQELLFSASRDKTIKVWDIHSVDLLKVIDQKYDAHRNSVNKLLYYPKRNLLISASDDSSIMAWHLQLTHEQTL